jgi:hypothetical protein
MRPYLRYDYLGVDRLTYKFIRSRVKRAQYFFF